MPLSGFISEEDGRPVSFAECIACSIDRHPCHFPAEVLQLMARSAEDRAAAGISATMLTGCLRKGRYARDLPYHVRPTKLWAATRGTLFHSLFEGRPTPGVFYETRIARTLPSGATITGKADKIDCNAGVIVDFKTVAEFPRSPRPQYIDQVNIYRYLAADGVVVTPGPDSPLQVGEHVRFAIATLGLVFATMAGIRKVPVPVRSLGDVEAFLEERVAAFNRPLPPRIVPDPTASKLCSEWCPFYARCLEAGNT